MIGDDANRDGEALFPPVPRFFAATESELALEKCQKIEQFAASLPKTPDRLVRTAAYFGAFVALGLIDASLGPTLSGLAENTASQLGQISFLFAARGLGYLVGSLAGGRLVDRVPGHRLLAGALGLLAAVMALVPQVSILWLLTGSLCVLGVAEGALDVGGNTLLVWTYGGQVAPFMNALHFFYGLGAFLSPIVVAQAVLISGDITLAYWVLGVLMLPMAVLLLRLPSPMRENQTLETGKDAHDANGEHKQPPAEARALLVLIMVFFFLYAGAEIGFGGWIFTYVVKLELGSETTAAYLTSAFWGALTLGRLLSVPIAVRVRPQVVLFAALLGSLASVSVVLLWPESSTVTWLGAIGLGLSMASIFPTTLSVAERRMPITGGVTGWFFVGASSGGMTIPWLIGQLFDSFGPGVLMLVVLIDLCIAVLIFIVLSHYSLRPSVAGNH